MPDRTPTASTRGPPPALLPVLMLAAALQSTATSAAEFVAPYVVSPPEDVERMLALADVGPGDYLIDLGSGDGRIVVTAALRGAMGHGVELDRELVAVARRNARAAEVGDRVTFRQDDIFETSLDHATVVTLYLMPDVNLRLRPRLLRELAPGTRIVSLSFDMGKWQADRHVPGRVSGGIHMWIVPARVQGRWRVNLDGRTLALTIEQQFQQIDARLDCACGNDFHVLEASLRGSRVSLLAGDGVDRYALSGEVQGDRMSGVVQVHGTGGTRTAAWQARRRQTAE